MNLEETARSYFSAFENKDIATLAEMFHDSVSLKDWNICVDGKESVLEANTDIFEFVGDLSVRVQNLYVCGLTAIAELLIVVDDTEALPVVDIIKFNTAKKIESIVAYRGN